MRYDENGQDRAKFLMLAIAIAIAMFAIYMMVFRADAPSIPESTIERPVEETLSEPESSSIYVDDESLEGTGNEPNFKGPLVGPDNFSEVEGEVAADEHADLYVAPNWIRNSVAVQVPPDSYKVAIVIDDLGEYPALTQEVIDLPAPVTLAFLPYPSGVREMAEKARQAGHEIMVHMPMEATRAELDTGSYVLRSDMDPEEFSATLLENLQAIDGYVGINNHMGSGLTQDRNAMDSVMSELAEQGLLFLDSRTIHTSVAGEVARNYNIPTIERDVFIDHETTPEAIQAALDLIQRIATEHGSVVAIGHPKRETLDALKAWIPSLEAKNIVLVPISAVASAEAPPKESSFNENLVPAEPPLQPSQLPE